MRGLREVGTGQREQKASGRRSETCWMEESARTVAMPVMRDGEPHANENRGEHTRSVEGMNPHAQALGRIKTPKKAASSRENGKLGGRTKIWETYRKVANAKGEL